MPVPNDLSPEEEAEFAQHGVPSAGPGREPLSEAPPEQQAEQQQTEQHQPAEQEPSQQQGRQTFHRPDGTFASRQEREQGQARPGQQQQEPPGEQGQEQPVEEGQGGETKMVPHAALHQARLRADQFARRTQLAETRLNAILARQQQGAPPEQMPDMGNDPAGYILALEQRLQKFEQERGETAQNQEIDTAISTDEDTFTQMVPDYPQASDYFVQSRAKELLAFHPPQEAQRIMLAEARQIARMAWERGQSVGETIYGLAQARGYNPGMPQREPFPQPQPQARPPQPQAGPRGIAAVESVTRSQQASRSLSGGGGASAESLNAAALLDMDETEFAQWLGEGPEATRRFANIG
jgi:hypothetical protein